MERKNLVVHQGGDRQVVEHLGQTLPHPGVAELPLALVVEAVGLSCLPALVIFICSFCLICFFICLLSWLPLSKVSLAGYLTLKRNLRTNQKIAVT